MGVEARKLRGAEIAQTGNVTKRGQHLWLVPSQTGAGTWVVDYTDGDPVCTCPDYEKRSSFFKHIFATLLLRPQAKPVKDKVRYTQDWANYNAAQINEKGHFVQLLRGLCEGIKMPEQSGRGRPKLPLSDVVFAAVTKVYGGMSGRRSSSEIRECLEEAPHYNSISRYLGRKNLTPILEKILHESALPLAGVERKFAMDSTGFSTRTYDRWFDEKWGKGRKRAKYRTAHALCGTLTHIVPALLVNDKGDATQLKPLLDRASSRFTIEEISADKAYSSKKNLQVAVEAGAVPYIPFKENTTGGEGQTLWKKFFHYFTYKQAEFSEHYHRRSNVETVSSMVKMKFGTALRSKSRVAQTNELYCKFICHNICVLIASIYELGVVAEFWKDAE